MSTEDEEATISIPSLIVVGVLLYFSYRYFFSSRSSAGSSGASNGLRFTAAQVEQISSMFPQLSRRDIMWDLHRNRGSVQATTERVLMGRGLDPVCASKTWWRGCSSDMRAGPSFVSTANHFHHIFNSIVFESSTCQDRTRPDHKIQPAVANKFKRKRERRRSSPSWMGKQQR